MLKRATLLDTDPVPDWAALVRACGGQPPNRDGTGASFTADLLNLIARADPLNLARLNTAYPDEVAAWMIWREYAPHVTCGQLRAAAERKAAHG
jgi:hypothetical protein